MALDHNTNEVPQADVDAALEALGISRERFNVISEVRILPKEVQVSVFETTEDGKFKILTTDMGNVAAMGIRTYRIVKK